MKIFIEEQLKYLQTKEIYERNLYHRKLDELIRTKNIVIIEGQRRVGKSSIIISYIKGNKINLNKIFYINKELDSMDKVSSVNDLEEAFTYFVKTYGEPKYIIIDEIQDIESWEKFIRKYNSYKKYNIIITGSNSKLLSGEMATYLTGRYFSLEVFPFSYKEFLEYNSYESSTKIFQEYIEFGGMPEVIFLENKQSKKDYLKNVLDSIILKDVIARYDIRDVELIEKLLKFLANNVGSLTSILNVSNYLKNQFNKEYSTRTIANYLRYLRFPYIINEVSRYDLKGKKVLEYNSKYYWTDVGLRNIFGYDYSKDIANILENIVYNKLRQDAYQVYVGANRGLEIDFVAEKNGERIYIQVCYLLATPEVVDREFGNLEKIKDNYRKIVLSLDNVFGNTHNGIEHLNIIDWLL